MRMVCPGLLVVLCSGCAAVATAPARPAPAERFAVVVSIDGLMPDAVLEPDAHGLRIPVLRALAADALVARPGATPVFPTVTYPNHTSMVTGVTPARHGITSNVVFDPEARNQEGWYWYAADIHAATLWDVAEAAGLKTAMVSWPVSVGARVTVLLPEIWRAGTADDVKLNAALATPGLLDRVAARFPDFRAGFTPPETKDRALVDAAVVAVETVRPQLLLVHIFGTDDAQHAHGPWSPEAIAAIEEADVQLGRLVQAVRAAGVWDRTLFLVVSDHGFQAFGRTLRPAAILRAAGLIDLDPAGRVRGWRAGAAVNGGSAYVYARDAEAAARARAALAGAEGVGRILDKDELRARGGDPTAAFAIEAADGWDLVAGLAGEPEPPGGTHGYDVERASMRATFLLRAPGIRPGALDGVRLVDVAPTVAAWLGLAMPGLDGRSRLPR